MVPISFVSEHIETLEEIDMEFKELAHIRESKDWPFRVVKGRRDRILVQLSSFRDRSHKKDVYIESLCTAILADLKSTAESRLRG